MARGLVEDWIKDISKNIKDYERVLQDKTGFDYISLAASATGLPKEEVIAGVRGLRVGVVPITAGQGIIGSFSEAVAAIVNCMNCEAFVTDATDVAGIYEAWQKGAKIVFFADDDKFVALNLMKNLAVDNSLATARGYVAALEGAVGGLLDKKVLVIGCGVVGREALNLLKRKGAKAFVFDINERVLNSLTAEGVSIVKDTSEFADFLQVVDASSQGGWLHKDWLHSEVWFAAPGVPLSLTAEAYEQHEERVIHDFLQIGVAVMLASVLK